MNIAVLGDGITAKSIKKFLTNSKDYHYTDISLADIIVTSPGIPPKNFPDTKKEIVSDLEFAFRILKTKKERPKIIGVTGTNGKTTVSSGLAHVLNTMCFGNIGVPLINYIHQLDQFEYIVVELSSYQLFSSPELCCDIAIILNITPDHIAWHETIESYINAKLSIIKSNTNTVYIQKKWLNKINGQFKGKIITIDELDQIELPKFLGEHNASNGAVITNCALQCGVSLVDIKKRLTTYEFPPFRCEKIYEDEHLTIINDSKSTNMASTLAAIKWCKGNDTVLILGGKPKEAFTKESVENLLTYCNSIYATGYLNEYQFEVPMKYKDKVHFFPTLKAATKEVLKVHKKGIILFSPAAASFDEFDNYMHRGESFNSYVKTSI